MGIYGQDWSSWQDAQPATAGLDFAFVKVTEGLSYVNPRWVSQQAAARAAGLVWGAYHYPHMANSVEAEADYFLAQVDLERGDLVVLDWEGYDDANKNLPESVQQVYKDEWLKYVKAKLPGHRVGLYCNLDYWARIDATGFYGDFLWIATAGLPAGEPGIKTPWVFHQYSADSVDHDFCSFESRAELQAWASYTQTPPPAPVAPPWPGRDLLLTHPHMTGADVREWQAQMRHRGWNLGATGPNRDGVDGEFGDLCDKACRAFQAEKGLTQDGIVGKITWAATWTAPIT